MLIRKCITMCCEVWRCKCRAPKCSASRTCVISSELVIQKRTWRTDSSGKRSAIDYRSSSCKSDRVVFLCLTRVTNAGTIPDEGTDLLVEYVDAFELACGKVGF
jgi:hypothetical protein